VFELEIDHVWSDASELSDEVKSQFTDSEADISAVSLFSWEEHCTECAIPHCFSTCDLYAPRKDGHCRRFLGGISPIEAASTIQGYIAKISFKRWAELLASANVRLVDVKTARRVERLSRRAETWVSRIPDHNISIMGRRGLSSRLYRRLKSRVAREGAWSGMEGAPDYFLAEVYNPNSFAVNLSLTMRNSMMGPTQIPFQTLLQLSPGFHRFKFPFRDMSHLIDDSRQLQIMLNPNLLDPAQEGLTLYFGMLTFVADRRFAAPVAGAAQPKTVKVVAWDLDQTVWQGILLEDGADGIRLKSGILEIIKELDRRGIVNSVVSKNHPEEALEQLKRFGLQEYMVFSKIGWEPKGASIKQLIADFDVGEDTVVFIDDSAFERAQVVSMNPKVRALDAMEYDRLLDRPEFSPPVTAEASKRREFYRTQEVRQGAQHAFDGDYTQFLRTCNIKLTIDPPVESQSARIHELVQRTNQLNYSGNRYSRPEIEAMIRNPDLDIYVMSCADTFGEYGVIGLAVVERAVPRLVDLMFSCRIQAKRVEHAFFTFLLSHYKAAGAERLEAMYRKTERNSKAGAVFADLGFSEAGIQDGVHAYHFDLHSAIPDDRIIHTLWQGKSWES